MSSIVVEPTRLRHLPALRNQFIHATHTSFSYLDMAQRMQVIRDNSLSQLVRSWAHPRRVLISARQDNVLCGYVIGSIEPPIANLYWLYVDPESRGSNIGLRLLTAMRRHVEQRGAQKMVLSTYDHQPYYIRQGFKVIDRKRLHGKDMDILCLTIGGYEN